VQVTHKTQERQTNEAQLVLEVLELVRSRRTEVGAMLQLHTDNDAVIKGNVGVLPDVEESGWMDWAYLTEVETAAVDAATMKQTQTHSSSSPPRDEAKSAPPADTVQQMMLTRHRNPFVPMDGVDAERYRDLEDESHELLTTESGLRAERAAKIQELKALERSLQHSETQLKDEIQRVGMQAKDAQQRAAQLIHTAETQLLLCLRDQESLATLSNVPIPVIHGHPSSHHRMITH